MTLALLALTAWAGYGDPVDGHPTWEERDLFFWGNAARVAPASWSEAYTAGGCAFADFEADEREPKPPLLYNHDLAEAARAHNEDMLRNDFFSHTSSDGTSFQDRVWRYYDGSGIGENIAWGYADSREAVLSGWMCSPGHRANLMWANFDEIGVAARQLMYTQDFGQRGVGTRPVASANHAPASPNGPVTFWVDVWTDQLEEARVILNGEPQVLALVAGAPGRGVYQAQGRSTGGCNAWYAEVREVDGSVTRFPETGSYGWGACAWDDPGARWVHEQLEPQESDTDDPDDTGAPDDTDRPDGDADPTDPVVVPGPETAGCTSVPGGSSWLVLAAIGLLAIRRRS